MWANIGLLFVFFLIGAVFAASEMALVSLRDSQVKTLSVKGKRGKAINELASNPNRFLSSVQIGVTLSGFLSSSFGGATLATQYLAPWLVDLGMPQSVSQALALVVVTIIVSYFSIVISELTAKRLAMQNAEQYSLILAPFVNGIAKFCRPVIWLLDVSTNLLVRILGGDPKVGKEVVSEEELRSMVATADSLGEEERQIMEEVFDAGASSLREVMVPRTEVAFLDGNIPAYKAVKEVRDGSHSRYPVTVGPRDEVIGFLHIRDLMDLDPEAQNYPIKQLARPILWLPDTLNVLRALSAMRTNHAQIAIVSDEYGGTAGIVSLEDLVEELIGEITDEYDLAEVELRRQHRMDQDLDGLMTLEEFGEKTGLILPEGPYDTIAGYFMAQIGKVPEIGDQITVALHSDQISEEEPEPTYIEFTVKELDGLRAAWFHTRTVSPEELAAGLKDSPLEQQNTYQGENNGNKTESNNTPVGQAKSATEDQTVQITTTDDAGKN